MNFADYMYSKSTLESLQEILKIHFLILKKERNGESNMTMSHVTFLHPIPTPIYNQNCFFFTNASILCVPFLLKEKICIEAVRRNGYSDVHHSQTVAPGGAGGALFDGLVLGLLLESSSLMKNLVAADSFDLSMTTGLVGNDIPMGGEIGLTSG